MQIGPVEILAQGPARVDPAEGAQGGCRLGAEPAMTQMLGRGLQHGHQSVQEHPVMHRGSRAAAIHHDARDRIREAGCPVIGLDRPHRPTVHGVQPLDPPMLPQQAALGLHIVPRRDQPWPIRRVGRAGGQAVGEHVGRDDEPPCWVQHAVRSDQPLLVGMLGGVAGRVQHDIVAGRGERPVALPAQERVRQQRARLQRQVAEFEPARVRRPTRFSHLVPPVCGEASTIRPAPVPGRGQPGMAGWHGSAPRRAPPPRR